MPLYEFKCLECGQYFETFSRPGREATRNIKCPYCGKNHVVKVMGSFTGPRSGYRRTLSSGVCGPGST